MTHSITLAALGALALAACSTEPPRAPGTNSWDMTAVEHCDMAHQYARLAAELEQAATAIDPARSIRLRQQAKDDREIASQHAQAANQVLEHSIFEDYEPPCTIDKGSTSGPGAGA